MGVWQKWLTDNHGISLQALKILKSTIGSITTLLGALFVGSRLELAEFYTFLYGEKTIDYHYAHHLYFGLGNHAPRKCYSTELGYRASPCKPLDGSLGAAAFQDLRQCTDAAAKEGSALLTFKLKTELQAGYELFTHNTVFFCRPRNYGQWFLRWPGPGGELSDGCV